MCGTWRLKPFGILNKRAERNEMGAAKVNIWKNYFFFPIEFLETYKVL